MLIMFLWRSAIKNLRTFFQSDSSRNCYYQYALLKSKTDIVIEVSLFENSSSLLLLYFPITPYPHTLIRHIKMRKSLASKKLKIDVINRDGKGWGGAGRGGAG